MNSMDASIEVIKMPSMPSNAVGRDSTLLSYHSAVVLHCSEVKFWPLDSTSTSQAGINYYCYCCCCWLPVARLADSCWLAWRQIRDWQRDCTQSDSLVSLIQQWTTTLVAWAPIGMGKGGTCPPLEICEAAALDPGYFSGFRIQFGGVSQLMEVVKQFFLLPWNNCTFTNLLVTEPRREHAKKSFFTRPICTKNR